jgi:hypothetical protein
MIDPTSLFHRFLENALNNHDSAGEADMLQQNSTTFLTEVKSSPASLVRDVFVLFFSGVGVIISVLFITYLSLAICDRCPCLNVTYDETEAVDVSRLARQAGFWGLTFKERMLILKELLVRTTFQKETDLEGGQLQKSTCYGYESGTPKQEADAVAKDDENNENEDEDANENEEQEDDSKSLSGMEDLEQVCCICLNDYQEGCNILTGKHCSHIFHYDCCMGWLTKHDTCPHCREEMVSPKEFRDTAFQLLGQDRITKLEEWRQNSTSTATEAQIRSSGEEQETEAIPPQDDEHDAETTPPREEEQNADAVLPTSSS